MQKIKKVLTFPYCFQWLILFFVFHGYSDFVGFIKLSSLGLLILKLSIAAWILFVACTRMYRNGYKAALLVTAVFSCYLFFGSIQDHLREIPLLFRFSKFIILIPLIVFFYLLLLAWLFIYKKPLIKLTTLLNVLLLVYIIYDIILISWRAGTIEKTTVASPAISVTPIADTVYKPDVYLILLDEYLGSAGLRDYFNYDNSDFESFLKQKGFYVCSKPSSNYSYTINSMASLFNMRYLDSSDLGTTYKYSYKRMAELINDNPTLEYFKRFNYSIHNFSPFVVSGNEVATSVTVLPKDISLITYKTAYNRIIKRIVLGEPQTWLNVSLISTWLYKKINDDHENKMKYVLSSAGKNSPAFTYIHLLMPHKPFIYDSTGNVADIFKGISANKKSGTDNLYLQYLIYTNKRITKFIDRLYKLTNGQAVIMVMSDHGYRNAAGKSAKKLFFNSFNAIYIPNGDYHLWYDSVSNVNQFPLLFNTLFGQQIPLKKDSCKF